MGFLKNLFSPPESSISKLDKALVSQLAQIESVAASGDFYGCGFNEEVRDSLHSLSSTRSNSFAYLNLGLIYLYGIDVQADLSKAHELILKSSALSNPYSDKYLALIEEEENHDYPKAAEYLEKAVDFGDDAAMVTLGLYYMEGKGVSVNKKHGINLWKKAASMGNAGAIHNLKIEFA